MHETTRAQDQAFDPDRVSWSEAGHLQVDCPDDRFPCAVLARRAAQSLGFERGRVEAVAMVTCELVQNAALHAGGGRFAVATAAELGLVRVEVIDRGQPFANLENALLDDHDDRGAVLPEARSGRHGLGCGLGAVLRLANFVDFELADEHKRISAVLRAEKNLHQPCPHRVRRLGR